MLKTNHKRPRLVGPPEPKRPKFKAETTTIHLDQYMMCYRLVRSEWKYADAVTAPMRATSRVYH